MVTTNEINAARRLGISEAEIQEARTNAINTARYSNKVRDWEKKKVAQVTIQKEVDDQSSRLFTRYISNMQRGVAQPFKKGARQSTSKSTTPEKVTTKLRVSSEDLKKMGKREPSKFKNVELVDPSQRKGRLPAFTMQQRIDQLTSKLDYFRRDGTKTKVISSGESVRVPKSARVNPTVFRAASQTKKKNEILISNPVVRDLKRTGHKVKVYQNQVIFTRGGETKVYSPLTGLITNAKGYSISFQKGEVVLQKGNEKKVITKDGRVVGASDVRGVTLRKRFIPTKAKEERAAKKVREKKQSNVVRFGKGLVELPLEYAKGNLELIKGIKKIPILSTVRKIVKVIIDMGIASKRLKQVAKLKNPQKKHIQYATNAFNEFQKNKNNINFIGVQAKKAKTILDKKEVQLATQINLLVAGGSVGIGIGGLTAKVTQVTLGSVGAVAFTAQGIETFKKPTPENFGRLSFFAIPTAIGVFKVIRKLSANFRPSVKSVSEMKLLLNKEKAYNQVLLRKALKGITIYRGRKKLKQNEAVTLLKKKKDVINQALKEIKWLENNKQIIKTRDYNPMIHTNKLKKLQGSYKTGIHVSTQPKVSKLFGQKVKEAKPITKKTIKEIKKLKIDQPQPKKLLTVTRLQKEIVSFFKRSKAVIGGGRAQNLQVPLIKRRLTTDYDGKVNRGAKELLLGFALLLNKKFGGGKLKFKVWASKNIGTYKLVDKSGKVLIELTNTKGKIPFVTNKQGVRVSPLKELIKGKIDALSKVQRIERKGKKDIKDLLTLIKGKVKLSGILEKSKNPSDTFQVVKIKGGMGKSRIAFDETHMYFDFDAAVGYSKGKPYSIIKFPIVKISKFPPNLRVLINKAAKGALSTSQAVRLRKMLNTHIKNNPDKFFISPSTASLPIGEREITLAVFSKFFKGNVYKTFDNSLQQFVSVVEVGFKKPQKVGLYKRFVDGWKKKPFRTLKLRLTNPDLLLIRKYNKLLSRGYSLSLGQKNIFLKIFDKLIPKGKKAQLSIGKKEKTDFGTKLSTVKRKGKLKSKISEIKKRKRRIDEAKAKRKIRQPVRLRKKPIKVTRVKIRKVKRSVARVPIRKRGRTKIRSTTRTPIRKRTPTRTPIRKRTPTRTPIRKRTPTRKRTPIRKRTPTKKRRPITTTKKPPKKPFIIGFDTKLPKGVVPIVKIVYRTRGRVNKISKALPLNKALSVGSKLVDRKLVRSFQVGIVGAARVKDIKRPSLRKFRLRKTKKVLLFVEKSKYSLDSIGELAGLQAARRAKKKR